ncbi:DMT family transporter [Rhodospirillaceae bacterium SYSU D60014]|uniref:DMT family transporter n=1 Tax=Virgifigura deserti TaxID=2268457 RepID=UPI000E66B458
MSAGLLYAFTVLFWGTSWFAIELQLGVVAPELSITYRFILSAGMLLLFCVATGRRLRFPLRDHLFMALQGASLFSLNYMLFYEAAAHLASGLLAVCFSTIVVMNIANGALFFRHAVDPRVAVGALFGLVGLGLVFWPEVAGFEFSREAALGLGLSLIATYLASLGNMVSVRHKQARIPVVESNAIGMAYGAALSLGLALGGGAPLAFDWSWTYVLSLIYLALFASVLGFGFYLTLLQRIGADRAAYATVLFPMVALAVSTLFEGYRWTALAAIGVGLVLAGNLLVLVRRRKRAPAPA